MKLLVVEYNGVSYWKQVQEASQDTICKEFGMGMIHGGWLVAKILKREGVEVVFTLSGGHIAGIYDGCVR